MQKLRQDGLRMRWTNTTGADVLSDQPVVVGNTVFIAAVNIPDTEEGNLAVGQVYEMPKVAGAAINQGDLPYFDLDGAANGAFRSDGVPAAGDIQDSAVCWKAAAAADVVVEVFLLRGVGTITP